MVIMMMMMIDEGKNSDSVSLAHARLANVSNQARILEWFDALGARAHGSRKALAVHKGGSLLATQIAPSHQTAAAGFRPANLSAY